MAAQKPNMPPGAFIKFEPMAVSALKEAMAPMANAISAATSEVEGLLAATADDSDIPTLAAYLAEHPPSPIALALLVEKARQSGRSSVFANAAQLKNAEAREWVRAQWVNKFGEWNSFAEFARDHVGLVRDEFGLTVTARQIETAWLKGLSRPPRQPSKKAGTLPPT